MPDTGFPQKCYHFSQFIHVQWRHCTKYNLKKPTVFYRTHLAALCCIYDVQPWKEKKKTRQWKTAWQLPKAFTISQKQGEKLSEWRVKHTVTTPPGDLLPERKHQVELTALSKSSVNVLLFKTFGGSFARISATETKLAELEKSTAAGKSVSDPTHCSAFRRATKSSGSVHEHASARDGVLSGFRVCEGGGVEAGGMRPSKEVQSPWPKSWAPASRFSLAADVAVFFLSTCCEHAASFDDLPTSPPSLLWGWQRESSPSVRDNSWEDSFESFKTECEMVCCGEQLLDSGVLKQSGTVGFGLLGSGQERALSLIAGADPLGAGQEKELASTSALFSLSFTLHSSKVALRSRKVFWIASSSPATLCLCFGSTVCTAHLAGLRNWALCPLVDAQSTSGGLERCPSAGLSDILNSRLLLLPEFWGGLFWTFEELPRSKLSTVTFFSYLQQKYKHLNVWYL